MDPGIFDEHRDVVRPEWVDYNDHFNMGFYLVAFDLATDAWLDHIGLGLADKQRHGVTTFTLEAHVNYLRELPGGAPLRFTTQLLGFDAKRIHYIHQMFHADEGFLAATNELMSLHVSEETRRSAPMADAVQAQLAGILERHRKFAPPATAGRAIGLEARP